MVGRSAAGACDIRPGLHVHAIVFQAESSAILACVKK
jgi:hypothetical protein